MGECCESEAGEVIRSNTVNCSGLADTGGDTVPGLGGDDVDVAAGGDTMLGDDDATLVGDREPHEEGGDVMEEPPVEEKDTEILFILSIPVFLSPFCFWKSCSSSKLPNMPDISWGRPIVVLAAVMSDLSSSRSLFNLARLF